MPTHPHRASDTRGWYARLRTWLAARPLGWRVSVPVALACAGLLATTSMINARGTDLRGGRHTDLIGLVGAQKAGVQDLRRDVRSLEVDVDRLSSQVGGAKIGQLHQQINRLETPTGLSGLGGPGLAISLDDAPLDQPGTDGVDPNLLVVHQQDIQAVVNGLWAGGADAMSLQGQRIISTTGIKCVGNTVLLQGVPYSPPYRITALGDPARLYDAVMGAPGVQTYLSFTQEPYNLGWSLRDGESLSVPAYAGPLELQFARPATLPGDGG